MDLSSPSVALVHPTPAQLGRQLLLNGEEWRGALSMEAYLRREKHLLNYGLASNSGLTFWALVDINQNPDSDKILAGCETLRKRGLVSKDGQVTEVTAHGICSVFTPPEGRGKKSASRMIQEVTKVLKTWQARSGPCMFAVLYSDIGKKFYAREGYKPFPSAHIHLSPESDAKSNVDASPEASALHDQDLKALCETDEALIRDKMERHRGGVAVALLPDHDTVVWHHAREDFVAKELHGKQPTVRGAIASAGEKRVWAIWSRVFYNSDPSQSKNNTLHIIRLAVEENDNGDAEDSEPQVTAIAAVLRLAQQEAKLWNMERVELWNPHDWALRAAQRLDPEVQVVHRESESIASLNWFGDAADEPNLVWTENEKYGWC